MVTGAALADPEGRLADEARRAESAATQPAQPERNPADAEWNLPTWEDIVRAHSTRVYRLGTAEIGRVGPGGEQRLVFGQVLGGERKWPHAQQPSAFRRRSGNSTGAKTVSYCDTRQAGKPRRSPVRG